MVRLWATSFVCGLCMAFAWPCLGFAGDWLPAAAAPRCQNQPGATSQQNVLLLGKARQRRRRRQEQEQGLLGSMMLHAKKKGSTDSSAAQNRPRPAVESTKAPKKMRLDDLLVSRGIAEDAKAAAAMVLAGDVFIQQDQRLSSPATKLPLDAVLRVRQRKDHPWASRGGIKLHFALNHFQLTQAVQGSVAIDVGCSTGGFTDVLLHYGAARVYAVDVGYGLLDYRLRGDQRVVLLERTNAKHLSQLHVPEAGGVDMVVCDASFTSLETVLPAALSMVKLGGALVCLVKPQFEAERGDIMSGGVVCDAGVHEEVCLKAQAWLNEQPGWQWVSTVASPIRGLDSGNIEFLMYGTKSKPKP